ncbi:MAG: hypothetical protein ABI835_17315, partial [Chloroflexota bacterium]
MNEDRKHADDLDAFLKARKAGQPATPSTPEADLAAELVDLAASLSLGRQPDQPSQRPQTLPSLKSDQLKEHLLKEQFLKEHLLKEQPPMIARSRTDSAWSLSLPLVATLLFVFFIGILLLPSFNMPTFAPPVQEESRLPIPVGGHLEGIDQTAMGFMRRAGMEWTVFKITYSPEATGTVLQTARQLIDGAHLQGFKVWITITGAPDAFAGSGGAAYDTGASVAGEIAALGADAIQVWETPNLSVR